MFAADLSWTDPTAETVGQRRERKARQGRSNASSCSDDSSQTTVARANSRAAPWKTSLHFGRGKKIPAIGMEPNEDDISNYPRSLPSAPVDICSCISIEERVSNNTAHRDGERLKQSRNMKDTGIITSCNYCKNRVIESQTRSFPHSQALRNFAIYSRNLLAIEGHGWTADSQPEPSPASTARVRDVFCGRSDDCREPPEDGVMVKKSVTITLEKSHAFAALELNGHRIKSTRAPETSYEPAPGKSFDRSSPRTGGSAWEPPRGWGVEKEVSGCRSPASFFTNESARQASVPAGELGKSHLPSANIRHFQRMIRYIMTADASEILQRLGEDSGLLGDFEAAEGLRFEKLLWAIMILENGTLDAFLEIPGVRRLHISEHKACAPIILFNTSISDIYYASYPISSLNLTYVTFNDLDSKAKSYITNVATTYMHLKNSPFIPLASSFVWRIFASKLPVSLPAAAIPTFLSEAFRLLKKGGSLQLRLINALPERRWLGSKLSAWLDEHLTIALEAECRCSRPCEIIPYWAGLAGFQAVDGEGLNLSKTYILRAAAVAGTVIEGQVSALVLREIWKDAWGENVYWRGNEERKWWWELEDIVNECRDMKTIWKIDHLCYFKPD